MYLGIFFKVKLSGRVIAFCVRGEKEEMTKTEMELPQSKSLSKCLPGGCQMLAFLNVWSGCLKFFLVN